MLDGSITGDKTRPGSHDLNTAVGRVYMNYKYKTRVVGNANCGVRTVFWIDDDYDFNAVNFNLGSGIPSIPTRDIFSFIIAQGEAEVFQVQSKIYSNSYGETDQDIRDNFQLHTTKPDDEYPDHTF